jgi:hypothetical protein
MEVMNKRQLGTTSKGNVEEFEVFMAAQVHTVIWSMTMCSLVGGY